MLILIKVFILIKYLYKKIIYSKKKKIYIYIKIVNKIKINMLLKLLLCFYSIL